MHEGRIVEWARATGQPIFGHSCPECGAQMTEMDRVNENGFIFVWFQCSRSGCPGQWLEKRAFGSAVISTNTARPAHIF